MRGILSTGMWLIAGTAFCHAACANTVIVDVGGTIPPVFSPQTVTIAQGDTVVFVNKGGAHNVVADDGSFACSHGCKGDAQGDTGAPSSLPWIFSLTFAKPGNIGYFCVNHGAPGKGMYGTIVVQAPPVPAPATGTAFAALFGCLLALFAAVRLRRQA